MKTVRTFSKLLRLLHNTSCIPSCDTSKVRVHARFIHNTVVLSAPIQKKPANSYARFVKDMYQEISQFEEKAKAPRVMSMIANKWKTMTEEEKEKYTLAYEEDKKEWLKNYENTTDEEKVAYKEKIKIKRERRIKAEVKKKKKKKSDVDPRENYQKLSSLAVFNYERYYTIRREFPALKQQDLFKLMIHEWNNLPHDQKKRYQDMAAAMRAKSKATMLLYTFMELYDECYIARPGESLYHN
ncbi:hypothetical protein LOD99_9614 [Oopsacas minuta]|uniref:HMG box domain-containing protein n=1 Tax=Oopsacas minuta TaxID=111878 RepID=A0AAV7KKQ8_9METZ|nr:hypothetical protein LOD99_9614 [Oopsacas minuta]